MCPGSSDPGPAAGPDSGARLRTYTLWIALLLIVAVFLVFGRVIGAEFVKWDDDINIYRNPHIGGLEASRLKWMFTDFKSSRVYVPFAWLTWAVVYELFGLNPRGYHLVNFLFHQANTLLVFAFLCRLFPMIAPVNAQSENQLAQRVSAAAGALIWALHPLQVEPVAWATAIGYVQGTFFMLLALLAYLRFLSDPGRPRRRFYWMSLLSFAVSLSTYPIALGCPLAFVILDWWQRRRLEKQPNAQSPLLTVPFWRDKIAYFLIVLSVLGITLYARHHHVGQWRQPPTMAEFTAASRAMQMFYCWAYYLWRPFAPLNLSPLYTTLMAFRPGSLPFVASALAVLVVTVVLLVSSRSRPGLCAFWICYLAVLFPFTGLFEYPHFTNDRYYYLVSVIGAVMVFFLLVRSWHKASLRSALLVIAGGLAVVCGLISSRQTRLWQNSVVLYEHMLKTLGADPYQAIIFYRMGNFYRESGDDRKARDCLNRALQVDPELAEAHESLAEVLYKSGETDDAIAHYRAALKVMPDDFQAHHNLGVALATQGKFEEAVAQFSEAVRLIPQSVNAHRNLARALGRLGRQDEAKIHELEAERLERQQ
jgi:lipoprotein NlpI